MDKHLGRFLDYCKNAAVNTGLHISFQISVFLFSYKHPGVEFLDDLVVLLLTFEELSCAPVFIPGVFRYMNPSISAEGSVKGRCWILKSDCLDSNPPCDFGQAF